MNFSNEGNDNLELKVPHCHFKCRFCRDCFGKGCIGELPGMGGVKNSRNFIENCEGWKKIYKEISNDSKKISELKNIKVLPKHIGIAPVTGAVQNIGFENEKDFYLPYFFSAKKTGISICVGDGFPDEKLEYGIEACKKLGEMGYFFFKPYPDDVLKKRINMAKPYGIAMGMDIDAYNIATMRNLVHLEKKNAAQLEWFRKESSLPLMIKGVFSEEDLELCKSVHPEIIVVSNHGGRVDAQDGSTADFLKKYVEKLKSVCNEIWVDGGIRCFEDIQTALFLGASKVLIARPFISGLCKSGVLGMTGKINEMLSKND